MYKNKKIAVIIAAAGSGTRMGSGIPKQFMELGGTTILARTVEVFSRHAGIDEIIIVTGEDYLSLCEYELSKKHNLPKIKGIICGGQKRQDSVYEGLKRLSEDADIVLIHDGARPFVTETVIQDVIEGAFLYGGAASAVPVKDTIKVAKDGIFINTPDRNNLYGVQTPQGFQKNLLLKAYQKAFSEDFYGTDDAVLVENLGEKVYLVKGDYNNIKITTIEDMAIGEAIVNNQSFSERSSSDKPVYLDFRTGIGYDVHRLVPDRPLILGGVSIPFEKGLLGHSDADVLVHALMDAMLGASGLGDIGVHFPDSDCRYKGISSISLLEKVSDLLEGEGFRVWNADMTIIAQRPKIAAYKEEMIGLIAAVLKVDKNRINIKGTTTEGLGFCGRGEGIAAQASVLIKKEK